MRFIFPHLWIAIPRQVHKRPSKQRLQGEWSCSTQALIPLPELELSTTEPTYIDRVKRLRRRPHQVAAHTEARTAKNTTFSRGGTLSQGTNPRQSVPLVDASYILGKIRISASDDPCTICHLPMFRKVMGIDNWQPQNPINTHHLGKKKTQKKTLRAWQRTQYGHFLPAEEYLTDMLSRGEQLRLSKSSWKRFRTESAPWETIMQGSTLRRSLALTTCDRHWEVGSRR